ncbi:MAG: hypothetical protein Wins2KO_31720 [Winogradskyella sp.]
MNTDKKVNEFVGTAFVSCSLRDEDKSFIQLVEDILIHHKLKPTGTIGRHSAAPLNIAEHMKENIPKADLVVIVATPRYMQKDLKTGKKSYGLSEMVHVEAGMAYMANKPVVVFVQEGTNVGNFLPNMTQYIILNGKQDDLDNKWRLINSLLNNAYKIASGKKSSDDTTLSLGGLIRGGLAVFGGLVLLDSILPNDEEND